MANGHIGNVLVDHQIKGMMRKGQIVADPDHVQPASMDLALGDRLDNIPALPGRAFGFTTREFSCDYPPYNTLILHQDGPTLLKGQVYMGEVDIELKLPRGVWGYCNPKSSGGRIDLLTYAWADGSSELNVIPEGFSGKLFILCIPQSFPIKPHPGVKLAQLRLFKGNRKIVHRHALMQIQQDDPLVTDIKQGKYMPPDLKPEFSADGLVLHLDLTGTPSHLMARDVEMPIDLKGRRNHCPAHYFYEKGFDRRGNLSLRPGEFILASSKEKIRIPSYLSAEMGAYKESLGEFRSHYAGFFDPGFGDKEGCIAVFEIRNTGTAPIQLLDGQPICVLRYEYLNEDPAELYGRTKSSEPSNYQGQQSLVAKYFAPWS